MIKKKILDNVSKQVKQEVKGLGRCKQIVELAHSLLEKEGIETTITVGSAAWRVGSNELALITFTSPEEEPEGSYYVANPGTKDRFHYWLVDEDGRILDFTTFTFRRMIASLDKIEGVKKKTGVTWCPDYLYTKKGECSSLYAVSNGRRDKMFYYKPYEDQNYKPSLTDDDNLEALVEGLKARGNTVKVMSYDEFLRSGYTLHPS